MIGWGLHTASVIADHEPVIDHDDPACVAAEPSSDSGYLSIYEYCMGTSLKELDTGVI